MNRRSLFYTLGNECFELLAYTTTCNPLNYSNGVLYKRLNAISITNVINVKDMP